MDPNPGVISAALWKSVPEIEHALRPVTLIEDGSSKVRFTGTATMLGDGRRRVLVTARHVLNGAEPKFVGPPRDDGYRWPRKSWSLKGLLTDLPDADLSWAVGTETAETTGSPRTFLPFALIRGELPAEAGASMLAVGFPASRAKLRSGQTKLQANLMAAVVEVAGADAYEQLKLDPRVQIALKYKRDSYVDGAGNPVVGANPKGMSGGALFMITYGQAEARPLFVVPFLVAILTEFHDEPSSVMVATRVECLFDGLELARSLTAPLYQRVDA